MSPLAAGRGGRRRWPLLLLHLLRLALLDLLLVLVLLLLLLVFLLGALYLRCLRLRHRGVSLRWFHCTAGAAL